MATLKGIDLIRRWVIQTSLKEKGKQGGVMITLPKKDFVDLNTSITAEKLMRNGIDPNSITSVNQVENIINQINKPRVISQGDPEFSGIMGRLTGSNVIKRDFGKPFKEEIKKMESESEIAERLTKGNKQSVQKLKMQKMLDEAIEDASPGFANDIKVDADLVAENLAERMGKVYDDLPTKERLDLYDQAYTGLSKQRFKNMKKPIAEGLSDKEFKSEKTSFRLNIAKNSPEFNQDLAKRITNKEIYTDLSDVQRKEFLKDLDFVLKNPRDGNADGGRIGFKMGRRAFLKALGAGLTGLGAAKTGIFSGFGKEGTKQVTKEIVKTPPVPGKPEWFDSLVNKVITQGDDVTKNFATKERQTVHVKKLNDNEQVQVERDLETGDVSVTYESPNNMGEDAVYLQYKAPQKLEEGRTVPADFEATELEPRGIRMGPDDYDIEFDGENVVSSVDELMSDTSTLKQFATNKKPTMKEFVESKNKKDRVQSINKDQVEQAEYLETKYGPGTDEGNPSFQNFDRSEDFASGGIARMLGE